MFFAAIIDTVTSVVLHGHILNLTDNCLSQNEQTTFVGVDAAGGVGGGVDSVWWYDLSFSVGCCWELSIVFKIWERGWQSQTEQTTNEQTTKQKIIAKKL